MRPSLRSVRRRSTTTLLVWPRCAGRLGAVMSLVVMGALLDVPALAAQVIRRNDVLMMDDRLLCTEPAHRSSNPVLIPPLGDDATAKSPRGFAGVTAAVSANAAKRPGEDTQAAGLAQLQYSVTSSAPCFAAWTVRLGGFVADDGSAAGAIEWESKGLSFGWGGDRGQVARAAVRLHGGVGTSADPAYDPLVDLERDAWAGTTLKVDVPVTIPIPSAPATITVHGQLSAQGNYGWDEAVRERRGRDVVPELNAALLLSVLRGIGPVNVVGLGYSYDRIEHESAFGALKRHQLMLDTEWFAKRLDVALQLGTERLAGTRLYRVFGIAFRPRGCTRCQWSF